MADGDYERRDGRNAELVRFKRILAEARRVRDRSPEKATAVATGEVSGAKL